MRTELLTASECEEGWYRCYELYLRALDSGRPVEALEAHEAMAQLKDRLRESACGI